MQRGRVVYLLSSGAYFAVAYGILFSYADNYFCSLSRGQARPIVSAKLALACTPWDAFAGACGTLAVRLIGKPSRWLRIFVSTVVAGVAFASISFWIYRGYGHFLFEDTWADVSCFFTEGYGMMFPIVVAPLLTAATLSRGWLIAKTLPTGDGSQS